MSYPSGILSAALSIMHPALYNAGLDGMEKLSAWAAENDEDMDDALEDWATVYTNVSVIANRATPFHRDHTPGRTGMIFWLVLGITRTVI